MDYMVKFVRSKSEGSFCTWYFEEIKMEDLIKICERMKSEWKCTSVGIFSPVEQFPTPWKLIKYI